MRRPSWQYRAACRGVDPLLFTGTEDETTSERLAREEQAKAVCAGCEVREECLAYTLGPPGREGERGGVWGGLTWEERKALKRRRRERVLA